MTKASDHEFEAPARKKLHPDTIRANLIRAGLFLAGWEMLKSQIERQICYFYGTEDIVPLSKEDYEKRGQPWKDAYQSERQYANKRYEEEVLALDTGKPKGKRFRASLRWLVKDGAITEEQAARVMEMLDHRNEIAHQLPNMILEPEHVGVDMAMIYDIKNLLIAIGVFWGRIDIDLDPSFEGREVSDDEIRSGVATFMEYIISTAEAAAPST